MPLFSVIIPTYNRRERLMRAIGSVLSQRWLDRELIVVDDGSTDGTAEAVRELDAGIRLLIQTNSGPSAARNSGARAATGVYLAFLDSDDQWFPWTLEHYAKVIDEHNRPAFVFGVGACHPDVVQAQQPSAAAFPCYLEAVARCAVEPLPSGVAIAREVFLVSGGFQNGLQVMEDMDLWLRIGLVPGFVHLEQPASFLRELHGANLGEHTQKSFASLQQLLHREREGVYPGGEAAVSVRVGLFLDKLMYYAAQYRRRGHAILALRSYIEVFRIQAGRWFRDPGFGGKPNRFLVSFPVFLVAPGLHGLLRRIFGYGKGA